VILVYDGEGERRAFTIYLCAWPRSVGNCLHLNTNDSPVTIHDIAAVKTNSPKITLNPSTIMEDRDPSAFFVALLPGVAEVGSGDLVEAPPRCRTSGEDMI
jgi:hypothetical protein